MLNLFGLTEITDDGFVAEESKFQISIQDLLPNIHIHKMITASIISIVYFQFR